MTDVRLGNNGKDSIEAAIESGSGGGGPTLLGPYTVNYNSDPKINSDIFPLPGGPVLTDGTMILQTIVLVPLAWIGDTPGMGIKVEIFGSGQAFGLVNLINSDNIVGAYPIVEPFFSDTHPFDGLRHLSALVDYEAIWAPTGYNAPEADVGIGIEIYSDSGAFSAGQVKLWFLVQMP